LNLATLKVKLATLRGEVDIETPWLTTYTHSRAYIEYGNIALNANKLHAKERNRHQADESQKMLAALQEGTKPERTRRKSQAG
jgi:hypothetical protein